LAARFLAAFFAGFFFAFAFIAVLAIVFASFSLLSRRSNQFELENTEQFQLICL
jgi:hypothetical protein